MHGGNASLSQRAQIGGIGSSNFPYDDVFADGTTPEKPIAARFPTWSRL
jgi:hypothetical protein